MIVKIHWVNWTKNILNKMRLASFLDIKSSNYCLRHGENFRFSHNIRVFNHSGIPEKINISNSVYLDNTTLEVYNKGFLFIDDYTFIGNSRIFCTLKVHVGKGCWIADNVFIMDSNLHPISSKRRFQDAVEFSQGVFPDVYMNIPNAPVIIENKVWIGVNSVILKGVTNGEGAVVGAGSVVTKDVPAWTIVAGNPARVIREIPEHER